MRAVVDRRRTVLSGPEAAIGELDDGKVLYLGPDRAGNLLEVVSVERDDRSEIVIHAMPMRSKYEPFLRGEGVSDA